MTDEDDNDIPVDTSDDLSAGRDSSSTDPNDFDMESEMDELIRHLRDARDDADHIFAVGCIIAYTPETNVVDDKGKPAEGMVWRMVNPNVHRDYENLMEVVEELDVFDSRVQDLQIQEEDSGPEIQAIGGVGSLGDLFGR